MKKLLLTGVVLCTALFSTKAQVVYNNELNDAYYSYAKEAWGNVSAVNPIIDFDQAWNDEGILDIKLMGAGGESDNGDRFVYAFTALEENKTNPVNVDFSQKLSVTMAIKSDVAFNLGVYLSDNSSVWNDETPATSAAVSVSSDFVVYQFDFEASYNNWENVSLAMNTISYLGFVFNEGDGGLPVTGNISIDYIKVAKNETLGVNQKLAQPFTSYPNPTKNNVNLSFGENVVGEVVVCNVTGQVIKTQSISGSESVIDIESLEAGQYILNVVTDKITETVKVVKN